MVKKQYALVVLVLVDAGGYQMLFHIPISFHFRSINYNEGLTEKAT